jgi:hypothetical protein
MKSILSKACYAILATIATCPILTWSLTIPNADTPVFYLVSSSTSSSNLLVSKVHALIHFATAFSSVFQPLRMNSAGSGSASLLGSGPPAQFYFYQGQLTVYDPNGNIFPYRPLINSAQISTGCETFGALVFVQGSSTNKCARSTSFQIQSNGQDSQLGAELVFNFVGGFYSCNSGQEVSNLIPVSA